MIDEAAKYVEAGMADDDSLDFDGFSELVRVREGGEHSAAELRARFRMMDTTGSGRVKKQDYPLFLLRAALAQSVSYVQEIFQRWDADGNGMVDASEFRKAIISLGLADVMPATIDQVFRELDDDGSGSVSYRELDRKLRKYAGISVTQRHDLRKVSGGRRGAALATTVKLDRASGKSIPTLLSEALASRGVRVMDLFHDWDEDGSGRIDQEEFFRGTVALKLDVTRAESNELFDEFDTDGSGEVDFRELNKLLRRRLMVERTAGRPSPLEMSRASLLRVRPPGPARASLAQASGATDASGSSTVVHLPSPRQALLYQHGLVAEYQTDRNEQCAFRRDITPGLRSEYTGSMPPNPWVKPPELTKLASLWLQPARGQEWRNRGQSGLSGLASPLVSPRGAPGAAPGAAPPHARPSALLSPRGPLPSRMKPSAGITLTAL